MKNFDEEFIREELWTIINACCDIKLMLQNKSARTLVLTCNHFDILEKKLKDIMVEVKKIRDDEDIRQMKSAVMDYLEEFAQGHKIKNKYEEMELVASAYNQAFWDKYKVFLRDVLSRTEWPYEKNR